MTDRNQLAERIEAAAQHEELVQEALRDAYLRGEMHYSIFSVADDTTTARLAALSFHAAALRAHAVKGEGS